MSPSLGVSSPLLCTFPGWDGIGPPSSPPKAPWPSLPLPPAPQHLESIFHACFCAPHAVLGLPCLHAFFYLSSKKGWHTLLCSLSTQHSLWHIISAQYICLKGRNNVPRQTLPLDYDHALDAWKYLWSDRKWTDLSDHLFGSHWSIVTCWPRATLRPSSLWTAVLCLWSLIPLLPWAPHSPSVLIRRYRKRVFPMNQKAILPPPLLCYLREL